MNQDFDRLHDLFLRYRNGEATPDERMELMKLIDNSDYAGALGRLIDEEIENDRQDNTIDSDAGLDEKKAGRIFTAILENAGEERRQVRKPHRTRLRVAATALAAAALVFAALAGIWLLDRRHPPALIQPLAARPGKQDVPPGKHAAVLTLGNGQQVAMDSSGAETHIRQGNMNLINLKGTLAYKDGKQPAPPDRGPIFNTLTTHPGNQYQLELPDGSRIWLNAASSVRFPLHFDPHAREVTITGEAYFEIAPDAKRPFIVHHKDMAVEVLGTHFNINAYADEQQVATTLLEGSVRIRHDQSASMIRPGQQARLSADGAIHIINDANTEEIIAWKNDLFYFRSTDIHSVMRQLARWYDVRVAYQGIATEERFYGRVPRNAPLSEVLNALSLTGKVHFNIDGKTVTVSP